MSSSDSSTSPASSSATTSEAPITVLSNMLQTTTVSGDAAGSEVNNESSSLSSPPAAAEVTEVHEPDNLAVAYLLKIGVDFKTYAHPAAFTCEEQHAILASIPGVLTKNLFLKDKKYGLYLITALDSREVNMKLVHKMLGLSGANLRLADEATLMDNLGVTRGSVSPLALLNDTKNQVKFCIDKALYETAILNVHPLRNDRTTSISNESFKKFLEEVKHPPIVLDFDSATL